jgi:hypothetical protein
MASTKTGFAVYSPEKIYELDNKLKGFQTPLSESDRTSVKEFVRKAKEKGLTINQAVQLASKATASTQEFQPETPQPDPIGTVTNEFSASAQQNQRATMQAKIDAAVEDWALGEAAKNLAIAQLVASGGNLSKYPQLQQMVEQSKVVRQAVEAANPAALPFGDMMMIAFHDVPMLAGKLPALPTTATLVLPAANETI